MFIKIDIKGANTLLINIPHNKASQALPVLCEMVEKNLLCLDVGYYSEHKVIKPTCTVVLSDELTVESGHGGSETALKILASDIVPTENFVEIGSKAYVDLNTVNHKLKKEVQELKESKTYLEKEVQKLKNYIESAVIQGFTVETCVTDI